MVEYAEIIFYASETVLVLGYSATRMIILRFMACLADLGYMLAALFIGLHEAGMTPTFIFAFISFLVNSIHIYRIVHMKVPVKLPAHYESVYNRKFTSFTHREFLYIMSISNKVTKENSEIISVDKPCDIFLCLNGELSVSLDRKIIATLPASSVVGEVSSLTGSHSLASVSTIGAAQLCQWTLKSMHKLEKKHPEIYLKFQTFLLGEMRCKLKW